MKTIEIIISPTGQTQLQTTGFQGRSCLDATRELEAELAELRQDKSSLVEESEWLQTELEGRPYHRLATN